MGTPGYMKVLVPEHLYLHALAAIGSLAEPRPEPLIVEHEVDPDRDDHLRLIQEQAEHISRLREQVDAEHRAALRIQQRYDQLAGLYDAMLSDKVDDRLLVVDLPGGLAYYDALIGQAAERAQELDGDESYPDFGPEDDAAAAMGLPAQTTGTLPAPEPEPELPSLVELRQALLTAKVPLRKLAEDIGVSLSTVQRGFSSTGSKLLTPELQARFHRDTAAYVAKLTGRPAPTPTPPPAPRPRPTKSPGVVDSAERDRLADRFVATVFERKPGEQMLSSRLPELYAEWAKYTDAPEVKHGWLGAAMKRAGYVSKLVHHRELHKSAQTYLDVAPRKMTEVQTIAAREAIEAARRANLPREEVKDEPAVTPYVAAKKAAPQKQPILDVRKRVDDKEFAGVRVVKADGTVTRVEHMSLVEAEAGAEPIPPEKADAQTFDLWTDYRGGYDKEFGYLPDVLALAGLDQDQITAAVRVPQRVEIRPETKTKGYPVLAFHRGDMQVVMGFRDRLHPVVIAAYWRALLEHSRHTVNRSGGGGSKGSTGLPGSVKASVAELRRRGLTIPDSWERATQPVEVSYKGKTLGKMKVHLANKQQVQGDYQRLLRQAHAIDRREEATVG